MNSTLRKCITLLYYNIVFIYGYFFQIHKKVYSTQTVELLIYWNVYSNDVNVTMTVGIFILRDRFFFKTYMMGEAAGMCFPPLQKIIDCTKISCWQLQCKIIFYLFVYCIVHVLIWFDLIFGV